MGHNRIKGSMQVTGSCRPVALARQSPDATADALDLPVSSAFLEASNYSSSAFLLQMGGSIRLRTCVNQMVHQHVRLAGSYRCWFVKKYCWLVYVREKYCSG